MQLEWYSKPFNNVFQIFYTAPPLSEFRPAMGAPLEARYTGGGGVGRGPNTHADKQAHHQPACLGRAAMGYGIYQLKIFPHTTLHPLITSF